MLTAQIVSPVKKKSSLKPNVVILLADDLGFGDLNCYGGVAKTPNLDAMAAKGIKFNNCYAGAPNCSPSRVSLLTGRNPVRVGMYSYRPPGSVMHLPDKELTIAELLKQAEYQTAHFGKWHLSSLPQDPELDQPQPDQQGFDYSFGTENNAMPSHLNPDNFVRNGTALGVLEGYSCQLIADEVDNWFEREYKKDQPFFLYIAFHEPHKKIASPEELKKHYTGNEKEVEYLANLENLDLATGSILGALKKRGLDKNTVIFFASDNGPYRPGSQGALRGLKGEVYEGGIKVPAIFSYPDIFPGNREIETPVWFQDTLPTIGAMCGIKPPDDRVYDGINLLPLLTGGDTVHRDQPMLWYFYRSSPEVAMREGDYMLIARVNDTLPRTHWIADIDMPFIKNSQPEYFELYNWANDPGQKQDLAALEPSILEAMKESFYVIFEDIRNEGPTWEGLPTYNPRKAHHNKSQEYIRNKKD